MAVVTTALAELADDRLARAAQGQLRVDSTVLASVAEMLAATRGVEDVTSAATVLPSVREYLAMVERFAADADRTVPPGCHWSGVRATAVRRVVACAVAPLAGRRTAP